MRLERLLARGGMGSVWVGKHIGLDVTVAVKFMANTTDQSVARFRREARVAAKIKSSNIVKILDFGVDQDVPYIVMELLDGENLGARLKRVGHVSLTEAERIIVPITRALEQAHRLLAFRNDNPARVQSNAVRSALGLARRTTAGVVSVGNGIGFSRGSESGASRSFRASNAKRRVQY